MNSGYTSIPFKTESDSGMSSVSGIAKFSAAGIVFEFEKKILGLFGVGLKEVKLPLHQILDIKIKRGFFRLSAKVEIKVKDLAAIAELPINGGKLVFKISREDFEQCQQAINNLTNTVADYNKNLPPVHTPVSRLFDDESEDETKKLIEK